MNDRDSELVAGMLIKHGYKLVDSPAKADVILFNTCSVRQKAEDKVWSEIGRIKKLKASSHKLQATSFKNKEYKKNTNGFAPEACSLKPEAKKVIVGLIGCMAQNYQQSAFARSPLIDLVVGPNNINSIPGLLADMTTEFSKGLAVGKEQRDEVVYNTEYIADKSHCNVIIAEGCNNFCSYCIVPYVRGRERSRPAEDILKEIKGLVNKEVKEITLLGQNVNSYQSQVASYRSQVEKQKNKKHETCNMKPVTFTDLLRMVNDIKGLKKFDFVTSHPKDASLEMFKSMAELDKCKKFLHLPVQSGSNKILKLMNRGYTREHYIELVKKGRDIVPGLKLTTDVMVGFPTETDADFEDTFNLFKEIKFDAAYIFKYSPRPHTKAAGLEDDVAVEVKKQRNQVLLQFQKKLYRSRQ